MIIHHRAVLRNNGSSSVKSGIFYNPGSITLLNQQIDIVKTCFFFLKLEFCYGKMYNTKKYDKKAGIVEVVAVIPPALR